MPSPIETLLSTVGLTAEDIQAINSLPEAEKFDANPYVQKVKENYQTQFKNDPKFFDDLTVEKLPTEVLKKIQGAQFQRASNIMKEKVLKGMGLTEAELGELTDEEKEKLDAYVQAVVNKYQKTKAGDKELQQQLIEARKKLEQFDGYEEKIKTKYDSEYDQKYTNAVFNAALIGELSSIQGLKINASDIAKTAHDLLASKYAFERVGDYSVELRLKSNPQMKVLKDGSSHELTLKEALHELATERGWIEKEEKSKEKQTGTIKIEPDKGKLKMVAPHVQEKLSKKIAAEG